VSILLSQVPCLSFNFSFFSCLFLLYLLQFSLSSTSSFSFFFVFKNSFGKLACQVATQVSYFRNALSFFETENFNPIFNVVFTSLSSVLFKLKPYLVKRQLKNYPTAKIKSIKDFKSGEKIPRMKQNPHKLLIKRELDNLLIVMNERTLLSIPEDCKKSTDIKG
jgi:hypothetical protein